MNPTYKSIALFAILIFVGMLSRRYNDALKKDEELNNYNAIQKYLLNDVTLGKSKKPILWIHVPYEYNSRKWESFGSRSSVDLNQPYMYLTARSIIRQCEKDFTIVIIDDDSFEKLLPDWKIETKKLSDPILSNIRKLGMMKLLYAYGGISCPISFVCLKNMKSLYETGCASTCMFICETVNRNTTSSMTEFSPNIEFCGCRKESSMMKNLISFMERTISQDFTNETEFLGHFDRWCKMRIIKKQIYLFDGLCVGTKTTEGKGMCIENLLSNSHIHLDDDAYGIYIPHREISKRITYGWFLRSSEQQILESNTMIGKYILLANAPDSNKSLKESESDDKIKGSEKWISFWKTPLYPSLYGLKPLSLGSTILSTSV